MFWNLICHLNQCTTLKTERLTNLQTCNQYNTVVTTLSRVQDEIFRLKYVKRKPSFQKLPYWTFKIARWQHKCGANIITLGSISDACIRAYNTSPNGFKVVIAVTKWDLRNGFKRQIVNDVQHSVGEAILTLFISFTAIWKTWQRCTFNTTGPSTQFLTHRSHTELRLFIPPWKFV
jgi:hypothetical protein